MRPDKTKIEDRFRESLDAWVQDARPTGGFLRGGYTRGPDVLAAFADGRALVESYLNESQEVA